MTHSMVEPPPGAWTVADLFERFGPIPLSRVRHDPAPGTACERDVLEIHDREGRLYELVDGVLVEKTVGTYESYLAACVIQLLGAYVKEKRLGIVLGPDGMMRLSPGLVRIPDVSFIALERLPGRRVPRGGMAELAPDLAVEVISRGNTPREMRQKLSEYFDAGVGLVWYVYPERREVHVHAGPEQVTVLGERDTLEGGEVVPGFRLGAGELFAEPGEETDI